jgi:cell division protein FtsQ
LRAKQVRRAGWQWKVGVPLVVVVVVVAVWLLVWGPVLVLKSVQVPGVAPGVAVEVRTAAALPPRVQLSRLDLLAAQRRVERIPVVRSAEVSRSWPSTVVIRVILRQPVAVVRDGHGTLHLADSTGTTYAVVSSAPAGLPLVGANATDPAAVQAVVQVLAALPAKLRSQVSSATAKDPQAVILAIGRVSVIWGGPEQTPRKAEVLQALRRDNPTVKRFDLSAPQSPSVG